MTIQTPTDPIRDEAVKVLAEALRSLGDAYPIFRQRPTMNDLGGETWWAHEPLAAAILDASPTLAVDLCFAAAWRAAVAALPEGWGIRLSGGGGRPWTAEAFDFERWTEGGDAWPCTFGASDADALAALAAKLGSGK